MSTRAPGEPQLPEHPRWRTAPHRRRSTLIVEIMLLSLGLLGGVFALAWIVAEGGAGSTLLSALLASLPLLVILALVWWVDRWEPEPRLLLMGALLWGAGAAVAGALVVNNAWFTAVEEASGSELLATVTGVVVGAPLSEEIFKGFGLLIIFLTRRRHFDGPVDGLVYAAVIAAGFAFTENIFYFGRAAEDGDLGLVFFGRAVMSPFAHVLFTAAMGIALGLASRARRRTWMWAFPVGLVAAILLHAVWNASAVLGVVYLLLFVVFQIPLFAAYITLIVWLRHDERMIIRGRLTEYAHAGWFAPMEVEMLTSLRGRRMARAWAKNQGSDAHRAMRDFQRYATWLAFTRQRVLIGRHDMGVRRDEHQLLSAVSRARAGWST